MQEGIYNYHRTRGRVRSLGLRQGLHTEEGVHDIIRRVRGLGLTARSSYCRLKCWVYFEEGVHDGIIRRVHGSGSDRKVFLL